MTIQAQLSFMRETSSQRTVALYKDQEKEIELLSRKLKKKLGYADIVREGVDIVLSELRKVAGEE